MNYRSEARKRHEDKRYDTETAGLLIALGIMLVGAAGLILARVWL